MRSPRIATGTTRDSGKGEESGIRGNSHDTTMEVGGSGVKVRGLPIGGSRPAGVERKKNIRIAFFYSSERERGREKEKKRKLTNSHFFLH